MSKVQLLEEIIDEVETLETLGDVLDYLNGRLEDEAREEELQSIMDYDEEKDLGSLLD